MLNTHKVDLPSSVKNYTYHQLAYAFAKLHNRPDIQKTNVSVNIKNMTPEIQKISTYQLYNEYKTIPGIGNIQKSIVRIMTFAGKKDNNTNNKTKIDTNTSLVISELEKQIKELTDTDPESNDIKTKQLMLSKLKKDISSQDDIYNLSNRQIMAIAKRVFSIFETGKQSSKSLYEEFELLTKPAFNYAIESSGGDYKLQNSSRDRRCKPDNKWRGEQSHPVIVNNTPPPKSKYIPSFLRDDNTVLSDTNKKSLYKPPCNRSDEHKYNADTSCNNNNEPSSLDTDNKKSSYVPPHLRTSNQNTSYDNNNNFISIHDIKSSTNFDLVSDFPTLKNNSTCGKLSNINTIDTSNSFGALDGWDDDTVNEPKEESPPIPKPTSGWGSKSFVSVLKEANERKTQEIQNTIDDSKPVVKKTSKLKPVKIKNNLSKHNTVSDDDNNGSNEDIYSDIDDDNDDNELYEGWGDDNDTYYNDDDDW